MSSNTAAGSSIQGARALELSGLVGYQVGSVVSRVILKGATGNVTVFAFDAGEGLSEHTAPFDALVQVFEGEAEITIGGQALTAKAGEVVLMPANVPHALKAGTAFKMMLTMIRS